MQVAGKKTQVLSPSCHNCTFAHLHTCNNKCDFNLSPTKNPIERAISNSIIVITDADGVVADA